MYTKGPWTVRQHNVSLDVEYKPVRVKDADDEEVIFVGKGDESLELAHLIAAAPDLLEALQATLLAYTQEIIASGEGDTIEIDGTVRLARAAIAKATQP